MPLTLVLGPANSAKAGEVLGAYADAAPRGALLAVPNARDADHYRRELARQGVVLGSVLTFTGLVEEIAQRTGYGAKRLTALQRDQLVARTVWSTELRSLRRAAETSGFAAATGELIAELERALITPDRFARALERWADEAEDRAAYASDAGTLYSAYTGELERLGRVDSELFAWRALDALRATPRAWGRDPVFFYGFDDLHSLQLDAIETLARVVGVEVMVSLTYEAGRAALQARAEAVEELRPLAERVMELPAVDDYYAPGSRHALHHLERQLFEPDPSSGPIDPGPAVGLLEAAGERAEAELVAAEVLELLRAGVRGEEIAVVYRSPAGEAPVIARVFAEYGVPAAFERHVALPETPLGQALLALARCAWLDELDSSPDDLLRYLRAPGVLRRPELADSLELEVRRRGLTTLAEARERAALGLAEIDTLAGSPDPAAELVRQARRLLAAPHRGAAAVLDDEEELDARALAAVVRAVTELDELGLRLTGPELIAMLETLEVQAGVASRDGAVLVCDPLAIRALRFRAVFVCGLQEGDFPRSATPEPFLSDEVRRDLARLGGIRLRQRGESLQRERYLFYSALSRATERVALSYRSSDEEGNLQLPSPFLADVAELLTDDWVQRRRRRLLADLVWPAADAPTPREREKTRAASGAYGVVPDTIRSRRLAPDTLAHVRHTEVVSAGALETYADCPVKWLVERELRPGRFAPDPEPLARGSYIHDVLEQVLERLARAVTPESLPQALEILEQVLAERPAPILPGRPEQVRRAAVEAIAADLRRYLRHEAGTGWDWEPGGLELQFGFEDEAESLPPLRLGAEAGRVAVRGAIDRVDVGPDGRRAVVRDYKSGGVRTEYQAGRWSSERRLQVALYMLAVRELLGLDPVAGLYQPLGGRDLRARGVFLEGEAVGAELFENDGRDREGLEAGLEEAAARAVSLAAKLRTGDVTPCPETCSREGCAYPGICRST